MAIRSSSTYPAMFLREAPNGSSAIIWGFFLVRPDPRDQSCGAVEWVDDRNELLFSGHFHRGRSAIFRGLLFFDRQLSPRAFRRHQELEMDDQQPGWHKLEGAR